VYLYSSSNNIVSGNNVSTSGGDGVSLYSSSNNIVSGNNVSTSGGDGVYLYSSSNNIVSGNNVSTSGGDGVLLDSSSNNNVSGNNVSTSGGAGVSLSASNNNFYNNFIKTVNSYARGVFVFGKSFNITIFNSTIETKKNDITFRENGSIQLINTTFNKSSVYWESSAKNAWINVSYFIDVYVRNLTDPLESAQVNITNYTNDQVFSGHTESNGYITTQLLPEYFANGSYTYSCPSSQSNITCSSPYNISASKGSLFNYTIEVVNQSKTVEIILFEKIISMMISDKLAEGIFFTSINGSVNNTQLPIQSDRWNNATWNYNNTPSPGDYKTLYWIHNEGNVNQDFCIKANDDLVCSQGECTSNKIPIFNVAFTNSTQNNENYPMFNESARLNTSFIKIAQNVQPDQYVYFRFWLYGNLTGKPSGIYNTTFTVKNVESGTSCN
jgi:parallel beta-helix repeat protein